LLVITGMPLKFYYTDWAKALFHVIGGAETARALHRLGAIVTFLYFGLHLCSVLLKAWRGRRKVRDPNSGQIQSQTILGSSFRARQHGAEPAGLAGFCRAQPLVFRQGRKAAIRALDVLGEVRLSRGLLGRGDYRHVRPHHVVSG